MLYLRPDWVDIKEAGDGAAKKFRFEAIREGWAWAERQWSKVTKDTGVGDPTKATVEKGEKYFKAVTEKVGNFFFDLATTPPKDFYE